ncbi:sensor histidine kinase [Streptomyces sp. NPDC058375]|uniref:sensor histidine kinase n=1 Tax=Streptomyces sp. NPDC058375 TaxID=3346467 RepID=UPI003662EE64
MKRNWNPSISAVWLPSPVWMPQPWNRTAPAASASRKASPFWATRLSSAVWWPTFWETSVCTTAPDAPCGIELSATRDAVVLRVEDRGPGTPPESQGYVFDRFYRADKGRSRAVGDTGLGLSIVSAVAELHHARVRLDSVPGRGTLIEITFPPGGRTGPGSR